jgi:hypothetical protein
MCCAGRGICFAVLCFAGLCWAGLGWAGLGWAGLGCALLGSCAGEHYHLAHGPCRLVSGPTEVFPV